jgi:hypothetical protein
MAKEERADVSKGSVAILGESSILGHNITGGCSHLRFPPFIK